MGIVSVTAVSHVALRVRDLAAQEAFYTQMVGLERTTRDAAGRVYLRCNANHHAMVLIPAGTSELDHVALDVGGPRQVEEAAARLASADIPHEQSSGEAGQGPAIRVRDPDGHVVELVGSLAQVSPHYGPRAVQPRKLGHVTLLVGNAKRAARFYCDVLGFQVSDWVAEQFVWVRCNPDHHGLALAEAGGRTGLHHSAFEVEHFADLVKQADHLMRNGRRLLYGPGHHGPGQNYFEYFRDAEGHIVEFTYGIQQIWDPGYVPKVWDPAQLWVNMWGPDAPPDFLEAGPREPVSQRSTEAAR